jgi:tetratricopeptide (TPR) repeat protein
MFFRPDSTELLPGVTSQMAIEKQAWLQARTAFCLTCLGRLNEAIGHREAELDYCRAQESDQSLSEAARRDLLRNTAYAAGMLSALMLLVGNLPEARRHARRAIELADRSGDWGQQVRARCRLGAVLHMQGDMDGADTLFRKAAQDHRANDARHPELNSDHGFLYRSFLLDGAADADYRAFELILHKAEAALDRDRRDLDHIWLVAIGLGILSKAAAKARMAERGKSRRDLDGAKNLFKEAEETLSDSGSVIEFPQFYLERARFELWHDLSIEAERDVIKASRDAEDYGMPLWQADAHLLRTEILIKVGDPSEIEQAKDYIARAADIIRAKGYGRREGQLSLLEQQLNQVH